jgi:hypothetical protein
MVGIRVEVRVDVRVWIGHIARLASDDESYL